MCQNFQKNLLTILDDSLQSIDSVIKVLDPNWSGLAKFEADSAAAIKAIEGWKSGTPAQDVVEIINDLIDDVNLFPVSPTYQVVITIALDGLKSIIVMLEEHSSGPTQVAAVKVMERITQEGSHAAWVPPTVVYEGTRQFTSAWNKAVSQFPNIAQCKMKVPKKWGILP
jgi:hypothetical protein